MSYTVVKEGAWRGVREGEGGKEKGGREKEEMWENRRDRFFFGEIWGGWFMDGEHRDEAEQMVSMCVTRSHGCRFGGGTLLLALHFLTSIFYFFLLCIFLQSFSWEARTIEGECSFEHTDRRRFLFERILTSADGVA